MSAHLLFILLILFGCWNSWGLNDLLKQREVRNFIHEHRFSLFLLVEIQVRFVTKEMVLQAGLECYLEL